MSTPQRYALAILVWHAEHGRNLAPTRLDGDELERYQADLEWLRNLDLDDDNSAPIVAKTQLERLRWSSWEPFPEAFRSVLAIDARTVGDIARAILTFRYGAFQSDHDASPLGPEQRRTIHYMSEEDLVRSARAAYPQYIAHEQSGIGGIEVLIAFALERQEYEGQVTFLSPEAYGLTEVAAGSRENDLLDYVREGTLRIDEAIGETISSEEGSDAIPHSDERE